MSSSASFKYFNTPQNVLNVVKEPLTLMCHITTYYTTFQRRNLEVVMNTFFCYTTNYPMLIFSACSSLPVEVESQRHSGERHATFRPSSSSLPIQSTAPEVREGTSLSASLVSLPPSRVVWKKSAKVWSKRSAMVTPLNAGSAACSEWPSVDVNLLQDFSKLHHYYGLEVSRAREEWLRGRATKGVLREVQEEHEDLINLN